MPRTAPASEQKGEFFMSPQKRIALNVGGGYVPGLNAIVTGVVRAADELGWSVAGIRDGFDGLLFPERYPDGGLVPLTADAGDVLGNATRTNPFCVRQVNAENQVEEVDLSGELIERAKANGLEAVISIVGPQALSILFKLHKQGLTTICVPTSVENDVAATQLSFGFNSALSFAVDMLERVRQAAHSAGKIGVVEVPGEHAGWLALQAGIAACADAVLIPEIPYDLHEIAARLRHKIDTGQASGLVVVAEGAAPREEDLQPAAVASDAFKAALSPGATGRARSHVIERSGLVAKTVALELQRLTDHATYPLVLGELVKGGPPTAVDRQLGLAYGAGAVRGVHAGRSGVMVSFQPPDLTFVPLAEAINRTRTVPADGMFMTVARALGISLGEREVRS
jgi:6-phosphofructokinase 1